MNFHSLDRSSISSHESPFIKEDIFRALKELDGNKSLRAYGFHLKFAQSFWLVFKDELVALFRSFHFLGEFDLRFFEAYVSFISKIKSPISLNDFRPIFLLGWVHKLIC